MFNMTFINLKRIKQLERDKTKYYLADFDKPIIASLNYIDKAKNKLEIVILYDKGYLIIKDYKHLLSKLDFLSFKDLINLILLFYIS